VVVAVIAAIAAGCIFAVGSVLQQSAAAEAPSDRSLSLRLLADLVRRPRWLLGIGSDAVSFGLQALALAFGPLALVQPLIVSGLLFALPMAARLRHRRLGPREWTATLLVAGGLALFLVAAAPREGEPTAPLTGWAVVLGCVAAVMVIGVIAGRAASGPAQPSFYALAAGTVFGLLAALTKTSTWLLDQGAVAFFTAWQPYAMVVVAVAGAIVQQSAFQAGPLATSLPVMDAAEPTTATLIGVFAFHESLGTSALAVSGEVAGIIALLAGIVALDRSPLVLALQRREYAAGSGQDASRARSSSANSGNLDATVSSGNSS
jgi:drug/metabolite transporter (DMT)-like permease